MTSKKYITSKLRPSEKAEESSDPIAKRVSETQQTMHDKLMKIWAKSLAVTGDIVGTGTEIVTIGVKGAATTLFKGARGVIKGLSA